MVYTKPVFRIMGDCACLAELSDEISLTVNQRIRALFLSIQEAPVAGLRECVPGYRSLMVLYDPLELSMGEVKAYLLDKAESLDTTSLPEPKTIEVPTVYGGSFGPDLEWVATFHNKSPEDMIRLHTGTTYHVYMIGFTPGFPYLGELPRGLVTPRRDTPRTAVPKGSVGIAQRQTGIYPVQSPGGWQIIGWTPLRLFDPGAWPPTPWEIGDQVRFFSIKEEDIHRWNGYQP